MGLLFLLDFNFHTCLGHGYLTPAPMFLFSGTAKSNKQGDYYDLMIKRCPQKTEKSEKSYII